MARTLRASLRTSMMVTTAAAALALAAPIGAVAQMQAQQIAASEYDIASMPMDSALNELAKQSGKQIVVYSEDVAGLVAPELIGAYTESSALDVLLEDTDLDYTFLNDRTIAVAPPSRMQAAQSVQLAQFEVDEEEAETIEDPDEDVLALEKVTVPGFRSSLASSLARKRNADQVLDAITAEDIGQFPDQNLTEAIQRIAGVQITRTNGEGEQVNIRGLSAQFTRVELDGRSTNVTIDSSNPERGSVLSVFASDLYNSIEVIKSPTAADVEGGVGGIVRLSTPDPLDIGELSWGFEGGLLRSDVREEREPTYTAFYSNVFDGGRLGLLLAGTYEERDRSIDKIQSNQNWIRIEEGDLDDNTDPDLLALVGSYYPGRIRHEQRNEEVDKINLNAKLQLQATDDLLLSLDGLYTTETRERELSRFQTQFSRTNGITAGVADPSTETLLEGTFNRVRAEPIQQFRDTDVTTYGVTGGFEWTFNDWDFQGELYASSAEEDYIEYTAGGRDNNVTVSYSLLNDPEYPEVIFAPGDLDIANFSQLRALNFEGRVISIEEQGLSFDSQREITVGPFTSFETGFRFASTEFDRMQGAVDAEGVTGFDEGSLGYVVDGSFADGFGGSDLLRIWPSVDPVEFYNQFPGTGSFFDGENADENLYNLTEDALAAYAVGNFETDAAFGWFTRGNLGVRVVETTYEGQGAVDLAGDAIADFGNIGRQTIDRDYVDVLPSFNFVVSEDADSNFLVRGAISRAMSRPEVAAINPGLVVRVDTIILPDDDPMDAVVDAPFAEVDIEIGNPELDPFRAWQYDLGFEWYFGENNESAVTAALFYKDVENFVVTTTDPDAVDAFVSSTIPASTITDYQTLAGLTGADIVYQGEIAVNGGEATVQGLELGFQTPFYFLPGLWQNFGVAANYTYTDSEFTTPEGETLPFPGASENSFNLVGYYEQGGFSGRIAYTFRDEFLITQGGFNDDTQRVENVEFNDDDGRLDLGLRYRFDNGLRVSFDALNLTEEQNFKYYDTPNRLEDLEVEGAIYQFAVGYKF